MPIIYQTARLPIVYKARLWSVANIFHIICTIIKYGAPILASLFYIGNHSGNTFGLENALVVPGNVLYFSLVDEDENIITFPSESDSPLTNSMFITVHPLYNSRNYVTSWKINVKISSNEGNSSKAVSAVILFNFTVNLQKWATNTVQSIGSFSKSFISGVSRIVCHGDLVLEQTDFIEFKGSFNGTNMENMDISNYDSISDIISARDEVSTLFYVDWDEPLMSFMDPDPDYFELELLIRVKDLTIFHSIPLVSSIETFLIIFLATFLLCALVLDTLQGFIFRHGIIKSWAIPLYRKVPKKSGSI